MHQLRCFLYGRHKPDILQLDKMLISHNKSISSKRLNCHFLTPNKPLLKFILGITKKELQNQTIIKKLNIQKSLVYKFF